MTIAIDWDVRPQTKPKRYIFYFKSNKSQISQPLLSQMGLLGEKSHVNFKKVVPYVN